MNPPVIAVDFDGVLCENKFPKIGTVDLQMVGILVMLQQWGCKLILWTCRQDVGEDKWLTEAIEWCKAYGIVFDAVNENILPWSGFSGLRRKVTCDFFIDDKSIGYDRNQTIDILKVMLEQEKRKHAGSAM